LDEAGDAFVARLLAFGARYLPAFMPSRDDG
jgi:hypothetical protein